jgi:hypothetical protein
MVGSDKGQARLATHIGHLGCPSESGAAGRRPTKLRPFAYLPRQARPASATPSTACICHAKHGLHLPRQARPASATPSTAAFRVPNRRGALRAFVQSESTPSPIAAVPSQLEVSSRLAPSHCQCLASAGRRLPFSVNSRQAAWRVLCSGSPREADGAGQPGQATFKLGDRRA